uniref:Uncharacterized protein n=1 Tax=Loa loa TaxID=7209 RepID=A0A1I7V8P6_LOALO
MSTTIDRGNFNTLCVIVLLCIISIRPSLACFGCCCGGCGKPKISGPPPPSFGYAVPPAPLPVYAAPPPPPPLPPLSQYAAVQPAYNKQPPVYKPGPIAYGVQQYDLAAINDDRTGIIQHFG